MPISHRYARLRPPCAAFVWAVHLTVLTADYNLPQSLCPPIKSGPGISQPILMLLSIWRGSQCPKASYPGIQRTQPPKQRWHTPMVHLSLVYATPCAPNPNGTCHLQLMALLMDLTTNYVNRYAHQMGQSLLTAVELSDCIKSVAVDMYATLLVVVLCMRGNRFASVV